MNTLKSHSRMIMCASIVVLIGMTVLVIRDGTPVIAAEEGHNPWEKPKGGDDEELKPIQPSKVHGKSAVGTKKQSCQVELALIHIQGNTGCCDTFLDLCKKPFEGSMADLLRMAQKESLVSLLVYDVHVSFRMDSNSLADTTINLKEEIISLYANANDLSSANPKVSIGIERVKKEDNSVIGGARASLSTANKQPVVLNASTTDGTVVNADGSRSTGSWSDMVIVSVWSSD
ncbi:MAG TPA: hypothetical protein VM186_01765 [Planctomycetota bacterium]|nr:hypothetical protein [Planctomycetota bacterium]